MDLASLSQRHDEYITNNKKFLRMAAMLQRNNLAQSFCHVPQSYAQTKSSRRVADCSVQVRGQFVGARVRYPPQEKGEDARSITFIMRLPFGADMLAG